MTNLKTARAAELSEGVPRVERPHLVKTQELPALGPSELQGEPHGSNSEAVPCAIADRDITVPVQSSIESTLTFEVLRRRSIDDDEDSGKP